MMENQTEQNNLEKVSKSAEFLKCTTINLLGGSMDTCGGKVNKDGKCTKCGTIAEMNQYGWNIEAHLGIEKEYHLIDIGSKNTVKVFNKINDYAETTVRKLTHIPMLVVARKFTELKTEALKITTPIDKETEKEFLPSTLQLATAQWLVKDYTFFYRVLEFYKKGYYIPAIKFKRYVVGEGENALLVTALIIQVALRTKNGLIWLEGTPATGKDTLVRMALDILPVKHNSLTHQTLGAMRYDQTEDTLEIEYISDAKQYEGEEARELRNRRTGDAGSTTQYANKNKDSGEMDTITVKRNVPIIATVNDLTKDNAVKSGSITIHMDDSEELTRKIKEEQLRELQGLHIFATDNEIAIFREAMRIICRDKVPDNNKQIVVPYAEAELIDLLFSSKITDSRRDIPKFFEIVKTLHWMRRHGLPKSQWYICDWVDLYLACRIGINAIRATFPELTKQELNVLNAIMYYHRERTTEEKNGGATSKEITDTYYCNGLAQGTVKNFLTSLKDKGYITLDKSGGQYSWYLNLNQITRGKDPADISKVGWSHVVQISPELLYNVVNKVVEKYNVLFDINLKVVDPINGKIVTTKLVDGKWKLCVDDINIRPLSEMQALITPEELKQVDEKKQELIGVVFEPEQQDKETPDFGDEEEEEDA